MKLRNPPIVEAWIEFHALGSDTEDTWLPGLGAFFAEVGAKYPVSERRIRETFQVIQAAPSGHPVQLEQQQELTGMRAFDKARRHCVQVMPDALIVNLIRGQEQYEGFRCLLPRALEHLRRFAKTFRPQAIRETALHYTDVVRVPVTADSSPQLSDYFRVGVQVPDEATWVLGRVALDLTVRLDASTGERDDLILVLRREPVPAGAAEVRFRMDWHAICSQLDTLDYYIIEQRLANVHDALKERFRECFTARTWETFDEEPEA